MNKRVSQGYFSGEISGHHLPRALSIVLVRETGGEVRKAQQGDHYPVILRGNIPGNPLAEYRSDCGDFLLFQIFFLTQLQKLGLNQLFVGAFL